MHVYIWILKVTLISFSLSYFHVSMIFRVKKDNPTMAESQMILGIERQTSIETEPMTLNIDQLQFARVCYNMFFFLFFICFYLVLEEGSWWLCFAGGGTVCDEHKEHGRSFDNFHRGSALSLFISLSIFFFFFSIFLLGF